MLNELIFKNIKEANDSLDRAEAELEEAKILLKSMLNFFDKRDEEIDAEIDRDLMEQECLGHCVKCGDELISDEDALCGKCV